MFNHLGKCCKGFKDLKSEIKNHGDKLVITISGDKKKLEELEKKLKAVHTLCCEGEDCCE